MDLACSGQMSKARFWASVKLAVRETFENEIELHRMLRDTYRYLSLFWPKTLNP